jgi:type IV pilus assembly protein PilY1
MRLHIHRNLAAASASAALLAIASGARAQQLDLNPPAPNVLILLDNSGSMERMIDGTIPEQSGNACNYDMNGQAIPTATPPQANRWGAVIQALTGTFENNQYNCIDMPRTSGGQFVKEYQIGGQKPYDADYYLDYHRPVLLDSSTTPPTACVIAPGSLPGAQPGAGVGPTGAGSGNNGVNMGQSATDFPPDGIIMRPFTSPTVTANPMSGACSQFPSKQYTSYQYQDGAIPSDTSLMRFGLMTFDQDPSQSTGVTTGANPTVVGSGFVDNKSPAFGAFAGMWSYYVGWDTGASCPFFGNLANCTPTSYAVGARNPAAPPWEGRMMRFPKDNVLATQTTNNANIASVILATRPYGATPLAGMLQDAEDYFWNDPTGPQKADPLVSCGARPQYIVLLTDGEPNLDMTPDCNNKGGSCPFRAPEKIVGELNAGMGANAPVTTFVIGFAVSSATIDSTPYQCSQLAAGGILSAKCQDANNPAALACCKLENIALAGSQNVLVNGVSQPNMNPTPAYFADTPGALQSALSAILGRISANAATRTAPAFSAGSQSVYLDPSSTSTNLGEEFLASFNPSPGRPVTGDLNRSRDVCQSVNGANSVSQVPPLESAGDLFAHNLNSNVGNVRKFIAFMPDANSSLMGSKFDPTATIRPYVTSSVKDGLGLYSARTFAGTATSVIPNITPQALNIGGPCAYNSSVTSVPVSPGLTAVQCAEMTLDFTFGQQTFASNPGNFPFVSRFGSALGGIFHASPAIVGAPNSLLQDPGYAGFQNTYKTREGMAYVATTDGLLHAFWSDETKLENNERWAMLLPAVMPTLHPSYPAGQTPLLDGTPVVKDVAWDRNIMSAGDPSVWHTMLVAGFGPNNQGYYAVDVTDPNESNLEGASGMVPADAPAGPHFRWQLTSMPGTNFQIFGAHSATPAITTLFMDPGDGNGAREIAVAILPGGSDVPPSVQGQCARADKTSNEAQPVGAYAFRPNVRCWGNGGTQQATDPVNGRAVAIVRIDTGEIIRVFERQADAMSATSDTLNTAHRVIDTPLDSPMTGTPMVYPSDVATLATKAFIADADGTIWRFDLSNSDPSKWTGDLFLDMYNQTVDSNSTAWTDGQPVTVSPTLSTDNTGEVVLNAGTGVTDTFDSTSIEFLYSITEKVQGSPAKLRAFVNWYMGTPLVAPAAGTGPTPSNPEKTVSSPAFLMGERVAGPMVVFDGKLYFATYAVPQTMTGVATGCGQNFARVWGVDYVAPADPNDRSKGGVPSLTQPGQAPVLDITPFQSAPANVPLLRTAVIPGVSINATPICATQGSAQTDQYVPNAQHSASTGMSAGGFSLTGQASAPGANGVGTQAVNISIPPPVAPTVINSWAAVLE